jgi:hypothetical protein
MGLTSPALPTHWNNGAEGSYINTQSDPYTFALRDQLNSVIPYQPTMPPVFNHWVRSYGPGLKDWEYNVGWKHVPVGNQVIPMIVRFESPDVPVTHLPYRPVLFESTLPYQQAQNEIYYSNLRAPAINEGY